MSEQSMQYVDTEEHPTPTQPGAVAEEQQQSVDGHGRRDVDEERVAQLRHVLATEGAEAARAFAGDAHQEELQQAAQDREQERQRAVDEWKTRQAEEIAREEQQEQKRQRQEEVQRQQQEEQRQQEEARQQQEQEQVQSQEAMGLGEQEVAEHEGPERDAPAQDRAEDSREAKQEPEPSRTLTPAERAYAAAERSEARDRAQEREGTGR